MTSEKNVIARIDCVGGKRHTWGSATEQAAQADAGNAPRCKVCGKTNVEVGHPAKSEARTIKRHAVRLDARVSAALLALQNASPETYADGNAEAIGALADAPIVDAPEAPAPPTHEERANAPLLTRGDGKNKRK